MRTIRHALPRIGDSVHRIVQFEHRNRFSPKLRLWAVGRCEVNPADLAWMLVSTALVLLMTPALAFFYGGLVRSKNALNTMMMSFVSLGFVGLIWAVLGYSLAFTGGNAVIGDLSNAFLRGVGLEAKGTIPHVL